MSVVKFSRVISCSSEDPRYPAINLLESQVGKCWKCKTPGEKQIIVVLQLERNCQIQSIDIGNENSAFVEIFVGRTAVPDHFEVFRVASILMSTAEAKKGENKNAVRFFKEEDFSKPAADESWDRIKILCTQPFNKLVPYGLSFIKIRAKNSAPDETVPSSDSSTQKNVLNSSSPSQTSLLGRFRLKQERKDTNDVSVGSFFARRGEVKDESPNTAALAIRAASTNPEPKRKRLSDLLVKLKDSKQPRQSDVDVSPVKTGRGRTTTGRLLYDEEQSDEETTSSEPVRVTRNENAVKNSKADDGPLIHKDLSGVDAESNKNPKTQNSLSRKDENSGSSSRRKKSPTKKTPNVRRKPFSRLLEDVVFVISGYQNPFRSELRSKALSMGAKYKADWDSSCTHLICAFPNTPKARTVRGKGWILRKEWIEECHSQRKRLPSRNYKMDKNDTFVFGNDEEIHEELPNQTTPTTNKVTNATRLPELTSSKDEKIPASNEDEENIYEAETDVESDEDTRQSRLTGDYETIDLEVLPDFLSGKKIYLGADLTKKINDMLERYVIAFSGEVVNDVDATDYIISEDTRYKENTANSPVLSPEWVWECASRKELVSIDLYML